MKSKVRIGVFCFPHSDVVYVVAGMNPRNGTDVDAANAIKVFGKLGYRCKYYNDQTVTEMKQVLTAGEGIKPLLRS